MILKLVLVDLYSTIFKLILDYTEEFTREISIYILLYLN